MSPSDLKSLQNLHRALRDLERQGSDGDFPLEPIQGIQRLLAAFRDHEIFELRKLAEIAPHLTPKMSMKHYVSWIVPVERLLQRELRDDEFLISSEDRPAVAVAEKLPLILVLDNLRSAFNVGSIFRTAECFGVQKIYLCGYTPLPTQTKLLKTAMGTDQWVEWEEAPRIETLLLQLRAQGYRLVALETAAQAKSLEADFGGAPTALILGNERFGLEAPLLKMCDEVRRIPLRGQKNSLNVGVAAGLAIYEFSRQWSPR